MRAVQILLYFLFLTNIAYGQEIFEYEKKIRNIENFSSTDLEFYNSKENIKLYGTLIEPPSGYDKIVIIVPGSGRNTRHTHHLLTENLLANNIAILRYDERGSGKSEGSDHTSNYTVTDMADDLTAVFNTIKNDAAYSFKKIGLLGHSQGGIVTMTLVENGLKPDFLVQWSTPVEKHGEFLKYQLKTGINKFENELMLDSDEKKLAVMSLFQHAFGGTPVDSDWKVDWKISKKALKEAKKIGYTNKNYNRFYFGNFESVKHILKKNLEPAYKNSEMPILYIIGSDDKYVDPVREVEVLKSLNNDNIQISVYPGLNHFLMKGDLSLDTMYEIDESAKIEISNWIQKQ